MLLAYIYRSITHRVHFLDKASRDLFISAKDLFVAATTKRGPSRVDGQGKLSGAGSEAIRPFPLFTQLRRRPTPLSRSDPVLRFVSRIKIENPRHRRTIMVQSDGSHCLGMGNCLPNKGKNP